MEKPEQWQRIKEIVGAALERQPGEREAFLEEACGQDAAVRAEVNSLLAAYASADGFFDAGPVTHHADTAQVSKSIGPYLPLEKLGEGGMGQVWLAEQTQPVRRKVALKLIRSGIYDDAALRRFQSERQSLAIMDHPAIAKVFDAGATPEGQPYFAMEYVRGVAITDYCDQKNLPIRERLELFVRVCEGVQHAHQKAILHRDLKPANILVMEVDGKPMPRVIDFGLAKSLTPHLSGESLNTLAGSFLGTPGYMSPEQVDPLALDIDTRADVYSLGVVLYELLTGFLPFDATQWKKMRLEEVLRRLREDDPLRPSTKVSLARETSTSQARARGVEPRQLVSLLRGDLDWIAMKALDKDRNRRYGSPSDLAADLARYLNHEPIVARPASTVYRLQKYARRHRLAVGLAGSAVLLLAGVAALQTIQLHRITRERDRADRVTQFMTDMFKVSDPSQARGNTITAREVLDRASKDIDSGLASNPDLQAQMMHVMGVVYENLGLYSRAQPLFQRAVDIRGQIFGPKSPETLRSVTFLAWEMARGGHHADAEKLLRDALETQRKILGPNNPDTMSSMFYLGWTLDVEGHYEEAAKFLRETVAVRRLVLGSEHPDTLSAMNLLASALSFGGHYDDAEKLFRETLDVRRRVLGEDHPQTLATRNGLGATLYREGHYSDAETLERETLDVRRRVLGPEHPQTLASMGNLALYLKAEGKLADAETLERETLEIRRRVLGPEQPNTMISMVNLAATLLLEGHYGEAEKLGKETLEIQRRVLGPENPETLGTMFNLGLTADVQGHFAEAEKWCRETLDLRRRVLGPEHPATLASMNELASIFQHSGRYQEGEKLSRETLEIQWRVVGPEAAETASTMDLLAVTLGKESKFDEAEKVERDALAIRRRVLGADNPQTADSEYNLAGILARHGQLDEALGFLKQALGHRLEMYHLLSMAADPSFTALRKDPRFQAVLADAKQRATPATPKAP